MLNVSDECVVAIAHGCRLLADVRLAECSRVSDSAVLALLTQCAHLAALDVRKCMRVLGDCFVEAGDCMPHRLTTLSISGTDFVSKPISVQIV